MYISAISISVCLQSEEGEQVEIEQVSMYIFGKVDRFWQKFMLNVPGPHLHLLQQEKLPKG